MPPKPKPKVFRGVRENAIKPNKEQDKAKTPVYTPQEFKKLQLKRNKPASKGSTGYKGATRV